MCNWFDNLGICLYSEMVPRDISRLWKTLIVFPQICTELCGIAHCIVCWSILRVLPLYWNFQHQWINYLVYCMNSFFCMYYIRCMYIFDLVKFWPCVDFVKQSCFLLLNICYTSILLQKKNSLKKKSYCKPKIAMTFLSMMFVLHM